MNLTNRRAMTPRGSFKRTPPVMASARQVVVAVLFGWLDRERDPSGLHLTLIVQEALLLADVPPGEPPAQALDRGQVRPRGVLDFQGTLEKVGVIGGQVHDLLLPGTRAEEARGLARQRQPRFADGLDTL